MLPAVIIAGTVKTLESEQVYDLTAMALYIIVLIANLPQVGNQVLR
jgi:hypothetical protein